MVQRIGRQPKNFGHGGTFHGRKILREESKLRNVGEDWDSPYVIGMYTQHSGAFRSGNGANPIPIFLKGGRPLSGTRCRPKVKPKVLGRITNGKVSPGWEMIRDPGPYDIGKVLTEGG